MHVVQLLFPLSAAVHVEIIKTGLPKGSRLPIIALKREGHLALQRFPQSLAHPSRHALLQHAEAKKEMASQFLTAPSLANIKTWQFRPEEKATFLVTYIYKIEGEETELPENPKVELDLPRLVKVTARPFKPTCNDCGVQSHSGNGAMTVRKPGDMSNEVGRVKREISVLPSTPVGELSISPRIEDIAGADVFVFFCSTGLLGPYSLFTVLAQSSFQNGTLLFSVVST